MRTDSGRRLDLSSQPELKKLKLASASACWTGCGKCNPTVLLANEADGSKMFMSHADKKATDREIPWSAIAYESRCRLTATARHWRRNAATGSDSTPHLF